MKIKFVLFVPEESKFQHRGANVTLMRRQMNWVCPETKSNVTIDGVTCRVKEIFHFPPRHIIVELIPDLPANKEELQTKLEAMVKSLKWTPQ